MDQRPSESADLLAWQYRLLPWAIGMLLALAIFFFASSWLQFDRLSAAMQTRQPDRMEQTFRDYEKGAGQQDVDYLKWKTRVLLERQVVERRYQQVNATLLLRTWTRHLGFLTGMILAFIGGIFILTKLSESGTQLSGETGMVKGSLQTSSPGIVLTVVGGAIMIVTLVTEYRFTTNDLPAYVTAEALAAPPPEELPDLSNAEARAAEEGDIFAEKQEGAK